MPHIPGRKQRIWMGNVTRPARGQFQMEEDKLTFDEDLIQCYDADSEEGYILGVDIT